MLSSVLISVRTRHSKNTSRNRGFCACPNLLYNGGDCPFPMAAVYSPLQTPMPTSQRNPLFHLSGPEARLDYLWSRLDQRDLSQDEALALISAVHREIGA